jgi:hypothetical protein
MPSRFLMRPLRNGATLGGPSERFLLAFELTEY